MTGRGLAALLRRRVADNDEQVVVQMLVAHARRPCVGERKIIVAMGKMTHADGVATAAA